MNLAEAANLVLTLSLKDQLSSGLDSINAKLGGLNTSGATLQGGLQKIGTGIGVGLRNAALIGVAGVGALTHQVMQGFDSLEELERVTAQTRAVIESTGGVAGITAEEVANLAQEYEDLTGVDDKVIQSGENVLLTFTNIREEGFEPALAAALDMSAAMDQDLQTSIVQIGKALNDPVNGLASLSRIGVNFDDATKDMIADMVAMGDTAGAQQLIIAELNKEFGGSAAAQMEGYRGSVTRLKDSWEDMQILLATKLEPAIGRIADKLDEFISSPKFIQGVEDLGDAIADMFSDENIDRGMDAVEGIFNFLRDLPWDNIKDGISLTADAAKRVVDVFKSLPPGVQAGLLTFLAANKLSGGLIASGLGELAKVALHSLKTITAANVTVVGANVTTPGTPGAPGAPGGGATPIVPVLLAAAAGAVVVKTADETLAGQVNNAATTLATNLPSMSESERTTAQQAAGFFHFLSNLPGMNIMLGDNATASQNLLDAVRTGNGSAIPLLNFISERTGATAQNTAATDGRIGFLVNPTQNTATNTGLIVGNTGRTAEQLGELNVIANNTAASRDNIAHLSTQLVTTHTILKGLDTNAQAIAGGVRGGNELNQRQIDRLQRLIGLDERGVVLSEAQRAKLERLQGIAGQSQTKLESIATSSQKTAKKDMSVDVTVKTTLTVSAREVADSIKRYVLMRGEKEFD